MLFGATAATDIRRDRETSTSRASGALTARLLSHRMRPLDPQESGRSRGGQGDSGEILDRPP